MISVDDFHAAENRLFDAEIHLAAVLSDYRQHVRHTSADPQWWSDGLALADTVHAARQLLERRCREYDAAILSALSTAISPIDIFTIHEEQEIR